MIYAQKAAQNKDKSKEAGVALQVREGIRQAQLHHHNREGQKPGGCPVIFENTGETNRQKEHVKAQIGQFSVKIVVLNQVELPNRKPA